MAEIGWDGISPVGELYPCSLRCSEALEIGKLALQILKKHKLIRLCQQIVQHATNDVFVDSSGNIYTSEHVSLDRVDLEKISFQEP